MRSLARSLRRAPRLLLRRPLRRSAEPGGELEQRRAQVPETKPHAIDPGALVRTATDPRDLYLA